MGVPSARSGVICESPLAILCSGRKGMLEFEMNGSSISAIHFFRSF
jgi:hypothetical protein